MFLFPFVTFALCSISPPKQLLVESPAAAAADSADAAAAAAAAEDQGLSIPVIGSSESTLSILVAVAVLGRIILIIVIRAFA